jgi:broad specificity phosphatase PhoE
MPSPVLYYIRHGETAWNAEGRFQGSRDIPLNDKGRAQASAAGSILRELMTRDGLVPADFHYVSSPLGRARVTMDLLRATLALPERGYALDDRLREISWGHWEGLTSPEMEAHDAVTFAARARDRWGVTAPQGETYAALTARVSAWLDELPGDTVAVAHGGTMRALMVATGVAQPIDAADARIEQGVVYMFADGRMTKYA